MPTNNETINRRIAEFMGLCWHEVTQNEGGQNCLKCGASVLVQRWRNLTVDPDWHYSVYENNLIPDYCSADSPRRLLDEVVAKLDTLKLGEELSLTLYGAGAMPKDVEDFHALIMAVGVSAKSTPEQIATAIYHCISEGKDVE